MTPRPNPNPKNPRWISEESFDRLQETMQRLGDIGGIVHNETSNLLVGGHQRSKVIDLQNCEIHIAETFSEPLPDGTTALGYVIWQGNRFNYRRVRWDEATAELAALVANKAGGKWDYEMLANEYDIDLLLEVGFTELELFGVEETQTAERDSEYQLVITASENEIESIRSYLDERDLAYKVKEKKKSKSA